MADRLGEDRGDFGTVFGPTKVALHAVAIAVELATQEQHCAGPAPSTPPGCPRSAEPAS